MDLFYNKNIKHALQELDSSYDGLNDEQVLQRANTKRRPPKQRRQGLVIKFLEQFSDFMIIILLIASAISIVVGVLEKQPSEIVDGCLILFIVLLNAIFGVAQEYKAEKSMEALAKLSQPQCLVLRNGGRKQLKTEDLVIGDIVCLDSGTIVPADLRLIEGFELKIDESSLTGESHASRKNPEEVCGKDSPIAERRNMAYKGTIVASGRGLGVVTSLGEDTEIGKIALSISDSKKEMSPLQKSIKDIGKVLTWLILIVAVATFIVEICITPNSIMEAFLTAVAIAVAAIPESMPAVITIIMSMGVARLAKEKAIVKRLPSVETLGCCDVICTDKTGTLTQNKMTVIKAYCNGKVIQGETASSAEFKLLVKGGVCCNDAETKNGNVVGDPTEVALINYGRKCGIFKDKITGKRIDERSFDSDRKMMSVLWENESERTIFSKGACDKILEKCDRILLHGEERLLLEKDKNDIIRVLNKMGDEALRVLAVAYKNVDNNENFEENNLVFVGLVGMLDPPRKETKEAIKKCIKAGMRPVMITGDHAKTAFAIAKEVGLVEKFSQVINGEALSTMTDKQLDEAVMKFCVFARVSPADKEKIVLALKRRGHVVAMTGDGVNDAPSLKKADIGIGMGKSGTDVAKEVSDIIIADDNFATIVVAVEQGRKIYSNIQKTVKFLFSANLAELLSLFVVTLFYPQFVFLYPVQILFTNLITDSLPAIALGLENADEDLMQRPPRNKKKGLFADGNGIAIVVLGLAQTIMVFLAYQMGLSYSPEVATTMAFYTLNIIQMFYLASMRTRVNIFKSKPHKNKFFLLSVGFCFLLVVIFALTPLGHIFKLVSLNATQWLLIFALSALMALISEIYKMIEKLVLKGKQRLST